eukprot:TRINITY_DN221_c0_g1_i1.p1 TRINITY_DN221_c0_g1~~TRINITY_DN221_c0_g1_i1.p1  ORF type:complete len:437 (-),score=117.42 TRINITY_DN221_c0_g1_i1:68-1324(-)
MTVKSWVDISPDSHFSIHNIPFGVFSRNGTEDRRIGTRIGDFVVDLHVLAEQGTFDPKVNNAFKQTTLNEFMSLGRSLWRSTRATLQSLFSEDSTLKNNEDLKKQALVSKDLVKMHLPANIGDYTDFYASREHATNVGIMFRGKDNALQPNWLHLPVGYHGRSSSVVVSGTPIKRPCGQQLPIADQPPIYGPCRLMDFELEMGAFVGVGNQLGDRITIQEAQDHIFGVVLLNDWSARDIQKWEYVPLGPFLGKNFGTTISPWIVTLDALEPFRVSGPVQEPTPLPYLQDKEAAAYDIHLEVAFKTPTTEHPFVVSKTNFKYMYWSMKQQLVHHSVNGCNMRPGDLLGSGTISGPTPDSYGSMLELAWQGTKPIQFPNGEQRKFIQDGDSIIMSAFCRNDQGVIVGFGECEGTLTPATP